MEILEKTFAANSVQNWLIAIALAVGFTVVVDLLKRFVQARVAEIVGHRAGPQWKALVEDIARRTKLVWGFIIGIRVGTEFLVLPKGPETIISKAAALALLVQVAIWTVAVVNFWVEKKTRELSEKSPEDVTTLRGLAILVKLGLWIIFVLMALDNLGFDITTLVAGLGIGGVAVALAVQNILGDLFASLTIVLDKPFVVGDFIVVGDLAGTVKNIGMKTTRVQSLSGEELIFSNNDLLQSRVRNFKRMMERRILFGVGVTYQTPADQLKRIPGMIREIIEKEELARFDRANFKAFGASSLDFEIVYFVRVPDFNTYMDVQERINLAIFERFEAEGIDFAYPTQTLFVEKLPVRYEAPSRPVPV